MVNVFVDPRCNIEYGAFYIIGLYTLFGKKNVSFDVLYFSDLNDTENFNFIIKTNHKLTRYTIDYNDSPYINKTAYQWCSYYGKINLRQPFVLAEMSQKIINIPPGFGIRIWNPLETLFIAALNYYRITPGSTSIKKYLSSYVKQLRHLRLYSYQSLPTLSNYIFSINTLWFSNEWINTDETVNCMRLNFYKAVSSLLSVRSEVGFVYSQKKNENSAFQEYVMNAWIPKEKYLLKTQQSVVVFNTPAWDLCHGWKLAEYLALGKAIISTPFYNELPVPLEHGKHIHFVSGSVDDIQAAVQKILTDDAYRLHLEQNSRIYYTQYVQPEAMLQHFLKEI